MHSVLVANHQGVLNRKNVVFCVGNGFIRSERSVNIRDSLVGNGFLFFSTFFHSTYLDKNLAEAECINAFPTQKSSDYSSIFTLGRFHRKWAASFLKMSTSRKPAIMAACWDWNSRSTSTISTAPAMAATA